MLTGIQGGEGGEELARQVIRVLGENKADFAPIYPDDMALEKKIEAVAQRIYGADGVTILPAAEKIDIDNTGKIDGLF